MKQAARYALPAAFSLYLLAAIALFYRPGLLDGTYILGNGTDPYLYIWAFHAIPRAIAHLRNPFIIPSAWAPAGLNITQATTTPGLALLFWPLTALVGPVTSFNIVTLLAPSLSATAACALAYTLTHRRLAAFIAGWIFGFSTYVTGAMLGHLQTDFVPLVPLAFLAVVLHHQNPNRLGPRAYVALLSTINIVQFLISLETFVTTALFLGIFVLVQALSHPDKPRLRRARTELALFALSYLITIAALSPYIYFFFRDYAEIPHTLQNGGYFCIDLLNLVIPTPVTWLGGQLATPITAHFSGGIAEDLGYIGAPLAIITLAAIARLARARAALPFIALTALAILCALGPQLRIAGRAIMPLPWHAIQALPFLSNVVTGRLMLYAALGIGIICALWLASLNRRTYHRASLATLAAALLTLPSSRADTHTGWYAKRPTPRLFTTQAYRSLIPRHSIVMFMPFQGANGDAILWTTLTNDYFRTINGYGNFIPPPFTAWPAATMLDKASIGPDFTEQLNLFMKHFGARRIVVPRRLASQWNQPLIRAGWSPTPSGRFTLYTLPIPAWTAIANGTATDARYAAARTHLDALRKAAACLLTKHAQTINPAAAVAANCLTPAFTSDPGPPTNWDKRGGWLGPFGGDGSIGIAVTTTKKIADRLATQDSKNARLIYYPYPTPYSPTTKPKSRKGELILAYPRTALQTP